MLNINSIQQTKYFGEYANFSKNKLNVVKKEKSIHHLDTLISLTSRVINVFHNRMY